jgi:hypothetical protein
MPRLTHMKAECGDCQIRGSSFITESTTTSTALPINQLIFLSTPLLFLPRIDQSQNNNTQCLDQEQVSNFLHSLSSG